MKMRLRVPVALGGVVLSFLAGGCDSDEQSMASCQMASAISFEGREYIAVNPRPGSEQRNARVGRRLGVGERATCPGQPEQQVQVYKLFGVPIGEGVFSKPEFGVMKRWNRDGTVE